MELLPGWLVTAILIFMGFWSVSRIMTHQHERRLDKALGGRERAGDDGSGENPDATTADAAHEASVLNQVLSVVDGLGSRSRHPSELPGMPPFEEAIGRLRSEMTDELLLAYIGSANNLLVLTVLETLSRGEGKIDSHLLLRGLDYQSPWVIFFALRAIASRVPSDEAVIGAVLARCPELWLSPAQVFLDEFIRRRIARGEEPTVRPHLDQLDPAEVHSLETLLTRLDPDLVCGLRGEVEEHLEAQKKSIQGSPPHVPGTGGAVGRQWSDADVKPEEPIVEHDLLRTTVERMKAVLTTERPRSVILVGDASVGKTTIMRVLGRHLLNSGWTIIEANQEDLIAGQMFIGQFEQRFRGFMERLSNERPILWYAPNFHELLWTGQHQHNPTGAMDHLLPYIESRQVIVVGESEPDAFERLVRERPRCRTLFQVEQIPHLSTQRTVDLARSWVDAITPAAAVRVIQNDLLEEAACLSEQYLGDRAAPGNLLALLNETREGLRRETPSRTGPIDRNDLMATLSRLTNLPASILDDRQSLDLEGLRRLFESRVLGQPEAVSCLVNCVAMIKTGLTDPTRPQGVFLMAGPTGTGKTEIAKALSEFLFGDPERAIRIDMSELQTQESLARLFGGGDGAHRENSLVDRIREQPFSVLLLDEFEKAHEQVWNLFLQVFDDGRLTDHRGLTANLRHAIIIMTTNLGGAIPGGATLGFTGERGDFRPEAVRKAIDEAFPKELINRIDRVIVFRPLSRETMRAILDKELRLIADRRGLRWREWATEWDQAALDFLLDKGITHDLGARPLRRAIERYVLAPLATVIAKRQAPEGDQFLFVRTDGNRLFVEFVDPDAPDIDATLAARGGLQVVAKVSPIEAGERADVGAEAIPRLESIVFSTRGTASEMCSLQQHYDHLTKMVGSDAWRERKWQALESVSDRGFWSSPDRFAILGRVEYLDRIERSLRGAGSLLNRLLHSQAGDRHQFPRRLIAGLAQKLYLLRIACDDACEERPVESFLQVEAVRGRGGGFDSADNVEAPDGQRPCDWAKEIGSMYLSWAEKRGMQVIVLHESADDRTHSYGLLAAVSGFGAHSILTPESGLHVAELQRGGMREIVRIRARVTVVPEPLEPPSGKTLEARKRSLQAQAARALSEVPPGAPAVVRTYRKGPAPLVRDHVRGYRCGRIERVLGGDFDVAGGVQ